MAPPKFVAPLKKNGNGTSMSLSSLAASSLDSIESTAPVLPVVEQSSNALKQVDPSVSVMSEPTDKPAENFASEGHAECSILGSSKNLSEKPSENVAIAKPVEFTGVDSSEPKALGKLPKNAVPGPRNMSAAPRFSRPQPVKKSAPGSIDIAKKSDEPSKKKRKVEPAPLTSNAQKTKAGNLPNGNDDKENVTSAIKKKAPKPSVSKPCVSLTDEQYNLIFQSVLAKYQDVGTTPASADPEKPGDTSKDLFDEFSQSDLEDSADEQADTKQGKGSNEKKQSESSTKDNQSASSDTATTNSEENISDTTKKMTLDSALNSTSNLHHGTDTSCETNTSKVISHGGSSQEESIPVSPMVSYLCHLSQPNLSGSILEILSLSEKERMNINSQPQSSCSQDFISAQQENITTSTPISSLKKQPDVNSPFASPKKIVSRPFSVSQEQNTSPAISQFSSPIKAPSVSTQNSQELTTSVHTPIKAPSVSTQNSQELRTPVRTPYTRALSVSHTPQNPISKVCCPAPSTPSCSQQISQEIQLTPPPPGKTARERLFWLQKKRQIGVWVQCDEEMCGKWRYLADCQDPTTLPEKWFCRMHPDQELNNCDAEEKRMSLHSEEDMIFNKYSPGSLVWAKLSGFPWWPAMVEDDPELEQFFWCDTFSDIPTWYHVVFLDKEERSAQRAWIQVERLKNFSKNVLEEYSEETAGFKKRLAAAYKMACSAQLLSIEDRLTQFSFAARFKGPIGGSSKRKYDGPLGYRKPVCE